MIYAGKGERAATFFCRTGEFMADQSINTHEMHGWLDRLQQGDPQALDRLLTRVSARLDRLSRKMMKRFPRIGRWVDAEDVLQNATLRLIRALKSVRPGSMREFYALASTQIRRELLDVTKSLYGPQGDGANHATRGPDETPIVENAARLPDEADVESWCRFHEEVDKLALEEREVIGLIFYHGWKQEQVAELFGVNVRTVQRWWQSALANLRAVLKDLPAV